MSKHNYIRALLKQPVERTPVWVMRQAGRYLPEYRKARKKAPNFMEFCKQPELACEVTLQPLQRFDLDAAIIFSDILTIPDALGMPLEFISGQGPVFPEPLRDEKSLVALQEREPLGDLQYVMDAIKLVKHELADKTPLIGFAGSPWTIGCYMVEGSGSKTFSQVKRLLYREPTLLHALLSLLSKHITQYLLAQVKAGADSLMVFDTWGGVLSGPCYQAFSLDYMSEIVAGVKQEAPHIPITLFTKGGGQWLEAMAVSGCDALGLDWTTDIANARHRVGNRVALQGNLDPCVLYSSPEGIRQEVKNILDQFGSHPGHVFNLGHGMYPDMSPEHMQVLVDAVHEFSQS